MITLQGKYNTAKVFTDTAENETISQIINLLNQEFTTGSKIRIMPDTHAGAGCVIGTTMTIEGIDVSESPNNGRSARIVPNLVGVDIGCGMETVMLKDKHVELQSLDKVIHEYIPAGFEIRDESHKFADEIQLDELHCLKEINYGRAVLSLGTLGGGNHFIELDKDDAGRLYLVVHSGSRHLGKQIAEHYQQAAFDSLKQNSAEINELIDTLKKAGRQKDIEKELKKIKTPHIDKALSYVEGELLNKYLHDMNIAQKYAVLNRKAITETIVKKMKLKVEDSFTTVHNYIDMESKILRKGAVSAKKDEQLLIPINMRDGSLICRGKGNPDWNYSAPHGAGRLMSRSKAKESITLSQFKKSMEGIYSTTISPSTLDESAFAYKPMEEIIENIGDTVEIVSIIRPVYSFKAAE